MLQNLQQKMSGLLAKIVLGIIVVIFGGFFGIEQYFNPRSETFVAKVDGHQISQESFRDRFNNMRMQMQRAYGKAFDPQTFDTPETKRRVLDQMINEQLIIDANTKLGVAVPPDQIRSEIESFPVFQVGGKFNSDQYRMWLDSQRKTPAEFEQTVRDNLQTRQLTEQLALGTVVTDAQVNDYLRLRDQTRDFSFIKIEPPTLDAKIDDDAIATYYKSHQQQFMTPEKVSLDYVELNEATMQAKADVDDATLKAEYAQQKSHFVAPEQRLASHILIAVDKNANAAAQKAALAKARAIEQQLKAGKSFETLAKADSDDLGSKAQGGDLGWLEKGVTDQAFESALFSMKKGEIS
ncbi:MAG TPA: SurA N-terminal domain-containing protein, partial [Rudaea sp.]|nr:SurA N-terminal domain-containing protein [Rudaea sp.]